MKVRHLFVAVLLGACAHEPTAMTPVATPAPPTPPPPIVAPPLGAAGGASFESAVSHLGTREFAAAYADVVEATIGALRSQGYEIAAQNARTGLIRTERRVVSRYEQAQLQPGGWGSAPTAVGYTVVISRQYSVTIQPRDAGHTVVVARPRLFTGDAEVTPTNLDGPGGEREAWDRLFHEIAELL